MIISHKHKFIFIKTRKTAGTSIEIALSKICGKGDIITPITPVDEVYRKEYSGLSAQNYCIPLSRYKKQDFAELIFKARAKKFHNHMASWEIKSYVKEEIWNTYYKFTIERNPFDRLVSLYYRRNRNNEYDNIYDFLINSGLHAFNNYDLYAIDNYVAVDKVYKYENMAYFLDDLSRKLSLNEKIELPKYKAKSSYRKTKDYKEALDEKLIDLIEVISAREIKLLDYKY